MMRYEETAVRPFRKVTTLARQVTLAMRVVTSDTRTFVGAFGGTG